MSQPALSTARVVWLLRAIDAARIEPAPFTLIGGFPARLSAPPKPPAFERFHHGNPLSQDELRLLADAGLVSTSMVAVGDGLEVVRVKLTAAGLLVLGAYHQQQTIIDAQREVIDRAKEGVPASVGCSRCRNEPVGLAACVPPQLHPREVQRLLGLFALDLHWSARGDFDAERMAQAARDLALDMLGDALVREAERHGGSLP